MVPSIPSSVEEASTPRELIGNPAPPAALHPPTTPTLTPTPTPTPSCTLSPNELISYFCLLPCAPVGPVLLYDGGCPPSSKVPTEGVSLNHQMSCHQASPIAVCSLRSLHDVSLPALSNMRFLPYAFGHSHHISQPTLNTNSRILTLVAVTHISFSQKPKLRNKP